MKLFNEEWLKNSLDKYGFSYNITKGGHDVYLVIKEIETFRFNKLKDLIDFARYNPKLLVSLSKYNEDDVKNLVKPSSINISEWCILNMLSSRYNINSGMADVDIIKNSDGSESYIYSSTRPILTFDSFSCYYNGEIKTPCMVLPIYNKDKFIEMNFNKIINLKF